MPVLLESFDANKVCQWCMDAYNRNGKALKFQSNTDRHRTYQWRYIELITKQLHEWGFDCDTAESFIEFSVEYAFKKRLLHKGLSIFFQGNLLSECYKSMLKRKVNDDRIIESVTDSLNYIRSLSISTDELTWMLTRKSFTSYYNITDGFVRNRISLVFLACSKSAFVALTRLSKLDRVERSLLPSKSKLIATRIGLEGNPTVIKLKSILKQDWRKICL